MPALQCQLPNLLRDLSQLLDLPSRLAPDTIRDNLPVRRGVLLDRSRSLRLLQRPDAGLPNLHDHHRLHHLQHLHVHDSQQLQPMCLPDRQPTNSRLGNLPMQLGLRRQWCGLVCDLLESDDGVSDLQFQDGVSDLQYGGQLGSDWVGLCLCVGLCQ